MIFSNFISGAKLDGPPPGAAEQEAAATFGLLEGATGRLRRLMQVSSSKLVGTRQQHHHVKLALNKSAQYAHATNTIIGGQQHVYQDQCHQTQQQQQQTFAPEHKEANQAKKSSDWQLDCKYTLSEVQQHCSLDDCWMVIFDKVYNITDFVYEHPGGDFILLEYAGRDATHPFLSSRHGSSAYKMLDKYWIGILVDEELYYSNNSSYCSVYSDLSWRSTPTLEDASSKSSSLAANAHAEAPDADREAHRDQVEAAHQAVADPIASLETDTPDAGQLVAPLVLPITGEDESQDDDDVDQHQRLDNAVHQLQLAQEQASRAPKSHQHQHQESRSTTATKNKQSQRRHRRQQTVASRTTTTSSATTTTTRTPQTLTMHKTNEPYISVIGRMNLCNDDQDEDHGSSDSDFADDLRECHTCSASVRPVRSVIEFH